MNPQQNTVAWIGGILIAVNFTIGGQWAEFIALIYNGTGSVTHLGNDLSVGTLRGILLEGLMLLVLILLAGTGPGGFQFSLWFLVALWAIWFLQNQTAVAKWLRVTL